MWRLSLVLALLAEADRELRLVYQNELFILREFFRNIGKLRKVKAGNDIVLAVFGRAVIHYGLLGKHTSAAHVDIHA